MKLSEALRIVGRLDAGELNAFRVFLACGFTPLHLRTFLTAHLSKRLADARPVVEVGLYGGLAKSLENLKADRADAVVAVVEWADLDPRLGVRNPHAWAGLSDDDLLETVDMSLTRLRAAIGKVAQNVPVCVVTPTLPLPPCFKSPTVRGNPTAFALRVSVARFATSLAAEPMVRVASPQELDRLSPPGDRLDAASELRSGFPYQSQHASAVGLVLAELIRPHAPMKGIITDLDNTLWHGILGEDGVDGISWNLENHSHAHAMYQGLLGSLMEIGVLVAVASKNDPELVKRALRRDDLALPADKLFPVEASWGAKSESVRDILEAWNIGPDSVVFIDDSRMELAEVKEAFPEVECLEFPTGKDNAVYELIEKLRDMFGKSTVTDEDRLRVESLRTSHQLHEHEAAPTGDDFLAQSEAGLTFSFDTPDQRTLELINKTSQFNLNGRRIDETSWKVRCEDPANFLLSASYVDKYGPLGNISVVSGRRQDDGLLVDIWVMSCRAFSRRIEYQVFRMLFERFSVDSVLLDVQATDRNGPIREFLAPMSEPLPDGRLRVIKGGFQAACPKLFHRVEIA